MPTDSPKNLSGAFAIHRSVTSIPITVGSLVLSLVVVSLFAFSSPSSLSQFGYHISADRLEIPLIVSDKSKDDTQKENQSLSNEETPSENVSQELVSLNPLNENKLGSNETLDKIKNPLVKNEKSVSESSDKIQNKSPLNSREESPESELSEKNERSKLLFSLIYFFFPILHEVSELKHYKF